MTFTDAQNLFTLFFAIYFALIIDRSHQTYKPWDTYSAWRGNPENVRRLVVAWIVLFVVPILHFSILFTLLDPVNVRFVATFRDITGLVLIGLGSFFDFGYFRIYEAFLHSCPESFFTDEELAPLVSSGKIHPHFQAHFMPGALYVIGSTLMILTAIALLS